MVEYASGSIRFNKLGGDTDFDEMVTKLYKIESRYAKQLLRWKGDWAKRSEAFGTIRQELLSMRTALMSMNSVDKFLTKTVTSSKEAVAVATAKSDAQEGIYQLQVNKLATNAVWSLDTGLENKMSIVNSSGTNGTFVYTYKNLRQEITIPSGTTLEGMKNLINNNSKNPGVRASLVQSSQGMVLQLRGMDTGVKAALSVDSATNIAAIPVDTHKKWNVTSNSAVLLEQYTANPPIINNTGQPQTFIYSYDGNKHTVTINDQETMHDLVSKINALTPGIASFDSPPGSFQLRLEKPDDTPIIDTTGDLDGIMATAYANKNVVVNSSGSDMTLNFEVDGVAKALTIPDGATLEDVAYYMNQQYAKTATVEKNTTTGKWHLKINKTPVYPHTIEIGSEGTLGTVKYEPPTSTNWLVQNSENGEIRINGWPADPQWLQVSSNAVSDAVEGLTFNLRSVGETTLAVGIDSNAIVDNVKKFVDTINSFRKMIQDMTKYDEEKEVLDLKYAESQFEMQKGSVLTGNYGIQLISSRLKQAVAGQAPGFSYMKKVDSVFFGDIFTSLSQIGIMTNTDEASENYGLLEVKLSPDGKGGLTFTEALEKNPQAVAELFSVKSQGKSDSPYFSHSSHIPSLTKPGEYKVEYTTGPTGEIISAKINGKDAVIYNDTKQIGLAASGPKNDADGLFVDVFDLTPNTTRTGEVRIREGKVNELLNMLDGSEGILNEEKGALGILERNYKQIQENINKKIKSEDDRLVKWERTTRLKFARLEAVLGQYNKLNEGLKSQLAQLKSDK